MREGLRRLLLQVFYSIRGERLPMEQLDDTFCFVGSSVSIWTISVG